jgi:catechol 2,3-dioxygenase-like lactoylglutathione lyase family enzyme
MAGLPGLRTVDHVGLTVPDLEGAVRFYSDVLGAEELYGMGPFDAAELPATEDGRDWTDAHVNVRDARLSFRVLKVGTTMLELFHYERPTGATAPPRNCDAGGHHIGFKVDDLDAAKAYLEGQGVTVFAGPIEIPKGSPGGPMRVNYFLDPWGNHLELTEYDRLGYEG